MQDEIGRKNPAEGVYILDDQPTIAFLTVCAHKREQRLATAEVHNALITAWHEADAWSVGYYMIMPDHIHLFCAPTNGVHTIEQWITFWKRQFRRNYGPNAPPFQSRGFHHRLRRDENYTDKWEYVRENPVRGGFVKNPDDWPYQGKLNDLEW